MSGKRSISVSGPEGGAKFVKEKTKKKKLTYTSIIVVRISLLITASVLDVESMYR